MLLCKVGQILFDRYQRVSSMFAEEYANADSEEGKEKIVNDLLFVISQYNSHVHDCIECNMDREKQ